MRNPIMLKTGLSTELLARAARKANREAIRWGRVGKSKGTSVLDRIDRGYAGNMKALRSRQKDKFLAHAGAAKNEPFFLTTERYGRGYNVTGDTRIMRRLMIEETDAKALKNRRVRAKDRLMGIKHRSGGYSDGKSHLFRGNAKRYTADLQGRVIKNFKDGDLERIRSGIAAKDKLRSSRLPVIIDKKLINMGEKGLKRIRNRKIMLGAGLLGLGIGAGAYVINKKRKEKEASMKCPIMLKVAARGEGLGVGGNRQGDLGANMCVCPKCGHKEKHTQGSPCSGTKCPKCGAVMGGTSRD